MIDLALALGASVSEWWVAPMGSASVAWRPNPSFEVQASGSASWMQLGHFTAPGREKSRCFCDGAVERVTSAGTLTLGVFPLHEVVGRWEVEVGLRVGGAVSRSRRASYEEWGGHVQIDQEPPTLLPGWTVEAVAGAGIGHVGVRLRLERLTWISMEREGSSAPVLLPRIEGYLRW